MHATPCSQNPSLEPICTTSQSLLSCPHVWSLCCTSGEDIRERTDALDAAGNTTAAIGKGFAIGSAALVSLALFGAYVTRAKIDLIESSILDPKVCVGGWMVPAVICCDLP